MPKHRSHQEVARGTVDEDVEAAQLCTGLLHPSFAVLVFSHISLYHA